MISVTTLRLADAVARSTVPLWPLADHIGVEPRELLDAAALARLPPRSLIHVAQAVKFPVAELFTRVNREPAYNDDAARVGACLGDHPQGLTRDTLARALSWDLDRAESALHGLNVRLATVGLRLNADGATIWIEGSPGTLQPETRVAFDRQPGDGQVNPDLGQAVWVATFGHDLPDGPPEGLAVAFRRNLVEASSGRSRGSDAVRFSLMLAEHGR
ncbi:MAG: hypothetical protein QOE57_877 [Acidimicrobiaceae bacterium]|jgi:hypothetical protein|nr:hypothetical protein [Acidimicrobiaceae bacterium]